MRYARNILDLIGNTPLVRLNKMAAGVRPTVLCKLEYLNPGGSVKDRIGISMIEAAEREGKLKRGGVIIEPTSGNTGVGLAQAAALKGYRCVFVMPDKMSQEKIRLLKAYGAEVVITPTAVPKESPESYYSVADRLEREIPNAFQPNQYYNPINPQTHYESTGPEIWEQTEGKIDVFVAGMGTGGTITGVARYLKEQNPNVKIVGVDPVGSLYTSNCIKPYKIEGIGEDFFPGTMDLNMVDEKIIVTDRDAFVTARHLCREEGILTGGSAGAAVFGALKYARQLDESKVIVVLLPDSGKSYLSKFHADEYMKEHGFWDPGSESVSIRDLLQSKPAPNGKIVTVEADEKVPSAIQVMRRYSVSQLPVLEGDRVVGSVQETDLMNLIFEDGSVLNQSVREVMSEPLPILPGDTTVSSVYQILLQGRPAVLVSDDGEKPTGIVTKIDLIDFISRSAEARA